VADNFSRCLAVHLQREQSQNPFISLCFLLAGVFLFCVLATAPRWRVSLLSKQKHSQISGNLAQSLTHAIRALTAFHFCKWIVKVRGMLSSIHSLLGGASKIAAPTPPSAREKNAYASINFLAFVFGAARLVLNKHTREFV